MDHPRSALCESCLLFVDASAARLGSNRVSHGGQTAADYAEGTRPPDDDAASNHAHQSSQTNGSRIELSVTPKNPRRLRGRSIFHNYLGDWTVYYGKPEDPERPEDTFRDARRVNNLQAHRKYFLWLGSLLLAY
jgi:hypothetical protein